MSSEALAWAMKQFVRPSGVKFTLVALCECANYKTGRITPSIAHLVEITGQNRKTIIAHIAQLEAQGYIADTGERTGQTKQIKVYSAAIGTVPNSEQFQKRNSSNSDREQSQNRDTEPSLEPSTPDIPNGISPPPSAGDKLKPEHFVEKWNALALRLGKPVVRNLTPERRVKLKARIAGYSLDDFREVLGNVERSPFLRGDKDWQGCTFDWITKKANFQKILEGNYNG